MQIKPSSDINVSSLSHIAEVHCGIVTVVGSFRALDLYTNAEPDVGALSVRLCQRDRVRGRWECKRTFAVNLAREGDHVEAGLDFARDEVGEVSHEAVDERGEHGEVVRRLERGREERVVLFGGLVSAKPTQSASE